MAERRSQPPSDSGSRRNLTNRKGEVTNVEHAYSGIVNVYALRPDGKPISLGDFTGGALVIPKDSKIWGQPPRPYQQKEAVKKPKQPKPQPLPTDTWGWDNTQAKPGLYAKRNGVFVKGLIADPTTYEHQLSIAGNSLVRNYDKADVKLNRALKALLKDEMKNPSLFQANSNNKFYTHAATLHIPIATMIDEYVRYKRQRTPQTEEPVIVQEVPSIPNTNELDPLRRQDYYEVSGDELNGLLQSNPSSVVHEMLPDGNIGYLALKSSNVMRNKHTQKVNARRIVYRLKKSNKSVKKNIKVIKKIVKKNLINPKVPIKTSRSSIIKKNLLNKLRCKCRRK